MFRAALGGAARERVARADCEIAEHIEVHTSGEGAPGVVDTMPVVMAVCGIHLRVAAVTHLQFHCVSLTCTGRNDKSQKCENDFFHRANSFNIHLA